VNLGFRLFQNNRVATLVVSQECL